MHAPRLSPDAAPMDDALPTIRRFPRLRVRWRRARRRTTWRDFVALGAVFVGLGVAAVAYQRSGVLLNHTGSMPLGLYRVTRAPRDAVSGAPVLTRGTPVVWCLPLRLVGEARHRGYLGAGPCPGGVESILKEVAAIPGDTVLVDSAGMAVNGRRLPNSRPLPFDSRGRPIGAVRAGTYPVRPGEAWVWSPYTPQSFDSRYYGALPLRDLVGVARPLWTRDQPHPDSAGRLPPGGGAPPAARPGGSA